MHYTIEQHPEPMFDDEECRAMYAFEDSGSIVELKQQLHDGLIHAREFGNAVESCTLINPPRRGETRRSRPINRQNKDAEKRIRAKCQVSFTATARFREFTRENPTPSYALRNGLHLRETTILHGCDLTPTFR